MKIKWLIPLFFLVFVAAAPKKNQWDEFVANYIEQYFRLHPDQAVDAGRHEFDGQLPDASPAAAAKEVAWLKEQREKAKAFDASSLDETQQFEREYLIAHVNRDLFWLDTAKWNRRTPLSFSASPSVYLTREYAPLVDRMKAYTKYARNFPGLLKQVQENLQTPIPKPHLEVATAVYRGYASYFRKDVPPIFASVTDEKVVADFKAANEGAAKAADAYAAWLEAQMPKATNNYAIGPELFRQMLRETEMVDISLEELEAIGQKDLERNLAMVKQACDRYAPGVAVEECVSRMQSKKPQEGPVAAARKQLVDLKRFVKEKELVTIPGPEEAGVEEAPAYRRFNAAYIEIPGPYEKNLPSIYYIAPPDPTWTAEQQKEYIPPEAELLAISVHEVWPGHFLHYLHANRSQSKFGQIFVGYAFSEGWAHYTEEMMWEAGLGNKDPEIHIGQLIHALLRNVRYLSAIGLHTKGMTVEESAKMFREKAFKDEGNAIQQARRGTFDPGYLNYTLGKLMILKLRKDWTSSRGGEKAWREFHDEFLSYGGPPIPLVRKAMLGNDKGSLF